MCRSLFPVSLISSHDQVCRGYKQVRVTRKKTIAEAVAIDEQERKRYALISYFLSFYFFFFLKKKA